MALKFMVTEKSSGDLVTVREICQRFNCPFDTISKVMQVMSERGILHSLQGVKGGYRLAKALSEISFMELYMVVEKKKHTDFCFSPYGPCVFISTCNIMGPLGRLYYQLNNYFSDLSLQDLLFDWRERKIMG